MSSMNVDRRDVVLRVVLLIGICVSGTANVLPNSTESHYTAANSLVKV